MTGGWTIATGILKASGTVAHDPVSPLELEFVRAFPYRAEIWTATGRLVVAGGLNDDGYFFPAERFDSAGAAAPAGRVAVVVDLLGVDEGMSS